jgi:hypothetical protein
MYGVAKLLNFRGNVYRTLSGFTLKKIPGIEIPGLVLLSLRKTKKTQTVNPIRIFIA